MATTEEMKAAVAAGYKAALEDATRMAQLSNAKKASKAAAAAEAEQRERAASLARMALRMAARYGRRR